MVAFMYRVHGFVQGVGYRAHVKSVAVACGISGHVRNLSDGSVEIVARGSEESVAKFESSIKVIRQNGPEVVAVEKEKIAEASIKNGFAVL